MSRPIRPRWGASSTPSLSDFSGGNHHSDPVPAMKRSRAQRIMSMEAGLIPGLLDCLALECLLRLPFHAILNARTVCKRWKQEIDSPSFYRIRRAAGLAPLVVALLLRGKLPHTMGKFHLALYEPDTGVCTMRQLAPDRPKMRSLPPDRPNLRMGFSDAAVVGRELVVIGGCAMENRRTGEVNIYDLFSGAWRPGAPNPAPERFLYRNLMIRGKVLAIGGFDKEDKKLQSALVYDVASDTWLEIPDLGQGSSIDGGNYCDKFWQSKEEYTSVIRCCRETLLLDLDDEHLRFNPTEGEKAITVSVPKLNKSDSTEKIGRKKFILNKKVLRKLRRQLGILSNQVEGYIESFYSGPL